MSYFAVSSVRLESEHNAVTNVVNVGERGMGAERSGAADISKHSRCDRVRPTVTKLCYCPSRSYSIGIGAISFVTRTTISMNLLWLRCRECGPIEYMKYKETHHRQLQCLELQRSYGMEMGSGL